LLFSLCHRISQSVANAIVEFQTAFGNGSMKVEQLLLLCLNPRGLANNQGILSAVAV
jgi:hypothetical protein